MSEIVYDPLGKSNSSSQVGGEILDLLLSYTGFTFFFACNKCLN